MSTAAPAFDPALWPHEAVACNLCGGDTPTVIAECDRYGLPTRIVQCGCGLRYISPRMTAEGYAAFYRDGYRPLLEQLRGEPLTLADLESDQWKYAHELLASIAPHLRRGMSMLDVGGSTGMIARVFRAQYGGRATVIDPSPDELAHVKGCDTICGNAEDVVFPKADVAFVCRTLDHLLDPKAVLTRLREATTLLVVDVMHVDGWLKIGRYKVDHPYAFTADTLKAIVEAAGWRPVQSWWRQNKRYAGLVCVPAEES